MESKDQRSRSQYDEEPSGRKHTVLDAMRQVLIYSFCFVAVCESYLW